MQTLRAVRVARFAAVAIVVLAVLAAAVLAWASRPVPVEAFYSVPAPDTATPGVLLASEPYARGVPAGARAWRIRYATTDSRGRLVTASGLVAVATAAHGDRRPLVAWAHGTTGVAAHCAPSIGPRPLGGAGFEAALDAGWIWVATDYVGLGTPGAHEYLVGIAEAHAVLDAIRAARMLPELHAGERAVVWGHSQGGHAALWTGSVAPTYAPDAGVIAIAAAAPATDLPELTAHVQHSIVGRVLNAYVLRAYALTYDDVRFAEWSRGMRGTLARRMADDCLEGRSVIAAIASATATGGTIFAADPRTGALGRRLAENAPTRPIVAPVLLAQGDADDLVAEAIQSRFVAQRCAAGQPIEYARYAGRDHLTLVRPDSPFVADLIEWTRARFAGAPAQEACTTRIVAP